ncbi:hypothetical protein [Nostoc sp. UHCC 0302]|uniref:hypothetical protein n=1 Tax=Nostoc sp. UHCC 0302 TaxID=3134896 RepID=UPI00311CC017
MSKRDWGLEIGNWGLGREEDEYDEYVDLYPNQILKEFLPQPPVPSSHRTIKKWPR